VDDPRRQAIERLPRWGVALAGSGLALASAATGELASLGLALAALGACLLLVRRALRPESVQQTRQREQAEAWARWTLGQGEWQGYLDTRRAEIGREGLRAGGVLAGVGAAAALLLGGLGASPLQPAWALAGASAAGGALAVALIAIGRRQIDALRRAPPEVVLGPGFGRVGSHTFRWHARAPWLRGGWELAGARLLPGAPSRVELDLRWRAQGLRQRFPRIRPRLPVPAERLDEARALLQPGGPLGGGGGPRPLGQARGGGRP